MQPYELAPALLLAMLSQRAAAPKEEPKEEPNTNSEDNSEHNLIEEPKEEPKEEPCGLLRFQQCWERVEVDISVGGQVITGTPIFIEGDAIRVINALHSYFIPLNKIAFIRIPNGLCQ